jgi:DivIVA domain-containing protein
MPPLAPRSDLRWRLMATNISRPDPSSAASVSSAQFKLTRRGFEQSEVRDFLRMVAAELARLQERERHLERELKSAQTRPVSAPTTFDDETATRLLGEEAAHILQAAREAAAQIKARTEDGAARLLREATEESHRLREEAEIEAARRRQEATSEAETEVNSAKQQGREMVNEARAYRERVLTELAKRREAAVQQIEQLGQGRDRLIQAFERARLASVDVLSDLTPLGEPDEFVNLAPVTGPIPVMVPAERPMALVPSVKNDTVVSMRKPFAVPDETEADQQREPAQVVSLFAGETGYQPVPEEVRLEEVLAQEAIPEDVPDEQEGEQLESSVANPSVEDLFARLRAARTEDIVVAAHVEVATVVSSVEPVAVDPVAVEPVAVEPVVDEPVAVEPAESNSDEVDDEPITPLIVAASRKLKRVLADEQNEVLDALRRKEQIRSLDAMLPSSAEHVARYVDAIRVELVAAAVAGAKGNRNGGDPAIVRPACDSVASEIVLPLRDRLVRCIDNADGNNADLSTQTRAVYREWKVNQIDDHLEQVVRLAFARGALTLSAR